MVNVNTLHSQNRRNECVDHIHLTMDMVWSFKLSFTHLHPKLIFRGTDISTTEADNFLFALEALHSTQWTHDSRQTLPSYNHNTHKNICHQSRHT